MRLAEEFTKNSYTFKQIFRDGNLAIYQQTGENGDVHFETVRIRKHKQDFHNKRAGDEYYPSDKAWGVDGFTFLSLESAKQKLKELKNPNHSTWQSQISDDLPKDIPNYGFDILNALSTKNQPVRIL
jgi:hypothetical protein